MMWKPPPGPNLQMNFRTSKGFFDVHGNDVNKGQTVKPGTKTREYMIATFIMYTRMDKT